MSQISQIYITDSIDEIPPFISSCISLIKDSYQNSPYVLYNQDSLRSFLEAEFDNSVLKAYDKIIPYAYKADLGRYCLLYNYGGWYFDLGFRLLNPLKMDDEVETLAFRDLSSIHTPWAIQNSVLYSKKSSRVFQKAIEILLSNVGNNYYGPNALCPTGPSVLGRAFALNGEDSNRIFGEFKHLTSTREVNNAAYILPDGTIMGFHKPSGGGDLDALGLKGTNNYLNLFRERNIYNI